MTKEDIAWSAAFFEGEGTITIQQSRNGTYSIWINANQKDKAPLLKLQRLWGGEITVFKSYGKPSTWMWHRNNRKALPFLQATKPFYEASLRKEEAGKYIEFFSLPDGRSANADWRPRAAIVAWFRTRIEKRDARCEAEMEAFIANGDKQNSQLAQ